MHEDSGLQSASLKEKPGRRDLNRQLCFCRSPHPLPEEMVLDSAVMREAESILTLDPF